MASFNPAKDIPDLSGKVYFITGGTAGLGAGTVTNLAAHNAAAIFFTGRREASANKLIETLAKSHPNVKVTFLQCDNAKLSSVRDAVSKFKAQSDRLDVLFCNAGIMAVPASTTADGYEVQFQTNHMAHALFMTLLTPLLEDTSRKHGGDARIVSLSSIAYKQAPSQGIDLATLKSAQEKLGNIVPGPQWSRYGQSKLANLLYARAWAKHHPELTVVSVHPGVIRTELFTNASIFLTLPVYLTNIGRFTPVEQGPYNQLWAGTVEKTKLESGEYYEPVGKVGKRTTKQANNDKLAEELYEWTQKELENFS